MKICVIGAAGGVGHHVVTEALAAGHQVRAVIRQSTLSITHPNLEVMTGNVLDAASMRQAISGCDAVISTIGSVGRDTTTLYSTGTATILSALEQTGIRRLLVVSASGLETDSNDTIIIRLAKVIVKRIFKGSYTDMRKMEQLLRASDTDWTIVRLAALKDKPQTGVYRTAVNQGVSNGFSISRADAAHYLVEHANDRATFKQRINIAY